MSESDENKAKREDNENDHDEFISTSILNTVDIVPEILRRKGDNFNDLRSLEFNSADDVRQGIKLQTMKAIPKVTRVEEYTDLQAETSLKIRQNDNVISGDCKTIDINIIKLPKDTSRNVQIRKSTSLESRTGDAMRRKRPGRPPKPGPSKKPRLNTRRDPAVYFVGKLRNVKRIYDSDSTLGSE